MASQAQTGAAITPNDQEFYVQWGLQMMQLPYAWEQLKGSASVIVGVIDSGVDATTPDLAGRVLPIGCDVVIDHVCPADGHGTPVTDPQGHGTAVAGIIAAITNNAIGVAGVAWNTSILPVRVTSGETGGSPADLVTGMRWAIDHGAKVLNVSASLDCGAEEPSDLKAVLAYASAQGALVVASAGNDGGCPKGVYPAADPQVISVASTDMNDHPSAFSNFGPWVRIAAPGEHIVTLAPNNQYKSQNGTSFSAPEVSGLAALLFAVPGATNASVRNWILSTCDVPAGWNPAYGCGRVNAYRAVSLAVRGIDPHTGSTAPATIHLTAGLNNFLYLGPTRRIDTALADLDGKYSSVYAWDPQRAVWSAFLPGQPTASDLSMLVERGAYWITMTTASDFSMHPTGNDPPPQLTLPAGWNNVALPAGTLPDPLKALSPSVKTVYAWSTASAAWIGFFADAPQASDLAVTRADAPYWVYVPSSLVITYHQ
ncbi:MAG: S8 family serine peptidase [Dehalococcoidia bacterium]